MINSVFGKTTKTLQKIISVRIVSNGKNYLKHTSKPSHITQRIFGKNYASIYEIKSVLTLNKPIYVGSTVPELSKWLMYDFHYNFIKKLFDTELLFRDTGSLIYENKSEDVYEEFFKHNHLFDLSNYPKDSKFFDPTNNKVIGKMKDVFEGNSIGKFIGLKSKMHCILSDTDEESNSKFTGVNTAIQFKEYEDIDRSKYCN